MKKKILALGLVLALVAVMALPMGVFAVDPTDGTDVTGTLPPTFALTAPTDVTLGGGTLVVGDNTGSSLTPGSVITNVAGWSLAVTDTTSDFMQIIDVGIGGTGHLNDPLTTTIQAGMASETLTTILLYQGLLRADTAHGYGKTGTFNIPLYTNQKVLATDAAGVYSISLTYTATPGTP